MGGDARGDDLENLGGLTNLKSLTLDRHYCNKDVAHEWLAAVGGLAQLERLHLDLDVDSQDLTYLVGLPNLKSLTLKCVDPYDEGEIAHEFLGVAGKLSQLGRLRLTVDVIRSQDLAYLTGLTNLKSLTLRLGITSRGSASGDNDGADEESDPDDETSDTKDDDGADGGSVSNDVPDPQDDNGADEEEEDLAHLPMLPQLEALDLHGIAVNDLGVRRLTALSGLRWLRLTATLVSAAGLAELAPLQSLEEVWIDHSMATQAGLESLIALKRLRAVHITGSGGSAVVWLDSEWPFSVSPSKVDGVRRGLLALRKAKPGIVIDTRYDDQPFEDKNEFEPPSHWESDKWVDRGQFHSVLKKCIDKP
jgi:hypothetical protein